ncbi:hypothetical protein Glove_242g2 [Diversispora epigaea]|uniref:Peptidase A2 domain-containing protein n=1 Tax=Diversispora epigaea TaxID=1348612 RepID=A0A397IAD0_9GLOM|nr:hypothetical protein Glove_242g2 [Diversispora epigaea]
MTSASDQSKISNIEGTSANTNQSDITQNTTIEDNSIIDTSSFNVPPELLESFKPHVRRPGEIQKFLNRMGNDFRWPASTHDNIKYHVFRAFTDDDEDIGEDDQEHALNCLHFYQILDKGQFNNHKKDWVLIYKQKVVKYGNEYTDQQLSDLDQKMPGAIYFPVDPLLREKIVNPKIPAARAVHSQRSVNGDEYMIKVRIKRVGLNDTSSVMFDYQFIEKKDKNKLYKTILDTGSPETVLPYEICRRIGKKGWHSLRVIATGYGKPAKLNLAKDSFEISIGDNNNWSDWVIIKTLRAWEAFPGDQIDSSLIGNDVLDQLIYVHCKEGELLFLEHRHEKNLANFLDNLSPGVSITLFQS